MLFCGDLPFNGGTPFPLAGLERDDRGAGHRGRCDPAAVLIPGHGRPSDGTLIGKVIGYLEFVLATARLGIAARLSPLDLVRETDLGGYAASWFDSERIVGNLHRAYVDLKTPGHQFNVTAAFQDMIAFNGVSS